MKKISKVFAISALALSTYAISETPSYAASQDLNIKNGGQASTLAAAPVSTVNYSMLTNQTTDILRGALRYEIISGSNLISISSTNSIKALKPGKATVYGYYSNGYIVYNINIVNP